MPKPVDADAVFVEQVIREMCKSSGFTFYLGRAELAAELLRMLRDRDVGAWGKGLIDFVDV